MVLLAVFSAAAATVSLVMNIPQARRLLRSGDTAGLSCSSLLNGSVNCVAWLGYMIAEQSWVPLVSTFTTSMVWFFLTVIAVPRLYTAGAWRTPTIWGGVVLGAALIDVRVFAVVLGLGVLSTYAPMVYSVWRAPSITGVSSTTWWLCLLDGLLWIGIGVTGDLLVGLGYGIIATMASAAVVAALLVRGPRLAASTAGSGPGDVSTHIEVADAPAGPLLPG